MSKMIIMQGLPASGKSTKAKELMLKGNTVRINKDLLREMLHFNKFTGHNEGVTKYTAEHLARSFIKSGSNVIIDETNLNPRTRQGWVDTAKELGAKIEHVVMDTGVHECIRRDQFRDKPVGAHVILKIAMQWCGHLKGEKVVVCDIDGTIADLEHRLKYASGETKNWDEFFARVGLDTPRAEIIERVVAKVREENAHLLFVSARPEKTREETQLWLDRVFNGMTLGKGRVGVIMREENDKREDILVKGDIYDKYLKDMDIVTVFDDRPSVIRMWRGKGLPVVDVGKGIEF